VGERVTVTDLVFDGMDPARFRSRLGACQQVFERMLAEDRFERGRKLCGVELELGPSRGRYSTSPRLRSPGRRLHDGGAGWIRTA